MSALPEVHNTRRTARRRAWESEGQRPALAWGTMLASSPSPPATRPAAPSGQPEHPWSSLVVATGLFSACWAALEGLDLFLARRPEAGFAGMNDLLTACAAIAAVVLGTVAMAQCRVATVRTRRVRTHRADPGRGTMGLGRAQVGRRRPAGVAMLAGRLGDQASGVEVEPVGAL